MSSYERYAETAAHYDRTRRAVGVEAVLGLLHRGQQAPAAMRLLEVGCGTGNYLAALEPHLGALVGLDLEPAMLERAAAKLDRALESGRLELRHGSALDLPWPEASFDAVLVNQVLHHLPGEADDPFAGWKRALAEIARVLRPGGVVVVGTTAHVQLERGYWYYRLLPEARARLAARYLDLDPLEALLADLGLTPLGRLVPTDAVLMGMAYFDPEGPFDPAWRAGDSFWALVTAAELETCLTTLTQRREAGTLQALVAELDRERPHVGQCVFLGARRA